MIKEKKKKTLPLSFWDLLMQREPALHDRHFSGRCHVEKLIERDTSGYAQVYVCQKSHKCSVTTLEQNGPWNTRWLPLYQ